MKRYRFLSWHTFFLLALLALSVQGCFGIGASSSSQSFKQVKTSSGNHIGINSGNQALFKGKIYFTQGRNLFVVDGNRNITQLTKNADVRDPAISPDGKWIAFTERFKDYANLVIMSTNGDPWHTLINGNGHFYANSGNFIQNDFYWIGQPSWSPDSSHVLFLSDFQKNFDWANLGGDFASAPFVDLQVFSIAINHPTYNGAQAKAAAQIVAYADYGDGGDRDPMYRPKNPDQIIFTHYTYDKTGTTQYIQLYLENPNAIAANPGKYSPGIEGSGLDPAVAITPTSVESMQPNFSPDGNTIAYIRRIDPTHSGLYVMPTPTTNVTANPNDPTVIKAALAPYKKSALIVSGQFISQPVWSPDSKQIAYLSYSNSEFDIWLANVSVDPKTGAYKMSGSPVQLTQGGVDADSRPFWTA
jgi:dipeptidyl aminopeptidase/acylaminoacyl peptidase